MSFGQRDEQLDGSQTVWPELAQLAQEYRIAVEYHDWKGERVQVSADSLRAVLTAFEVDASTPAACRAALAERGRAESARPLPPCPATRCRYLPRRPNFTSRHFGHQP